VEYFTIVFNHVAIYFYTIEYEFYKCIEKKLKCFKYLRNYFILINTAELPDMFGTVSYMKIV